MKAKSVKQSELGTNCWSPKRFFGECHECDRVEHCKYSGTGEDVAAARGRLKLAEKREQAARSEASKARALRRQRQQELEEIVGGRQ